MTKRLKREMEALYAECDKLGLDIVRTPHTTTIQHRDAIREQLKEFRGQSTIKETANRIDPFSSRKSVEQTIKELKAQLRKER